MDTMRKKQLMEEYKNRRPEMGVLEIRCRETGERFLGITRDFRADTNSNFAKLRMDSHPNRELQALWNRLGEEEFDIILAKTLDYDDPREDQTAKLNALRENCLLTDAVAKKIWR